MVDLKNKKQYAILQVKLFNYANILENLVSMYIENPTSISYKKIVNLNDTINNLINYSEKLYNNIIYYELLG